MLSSVPVPAPALYTTPDSYYVPAYVWYTAVALVSCSCTGSCIHLLFPAPVPSNVYCSCHLLLPGSCIQFLSSYHMPLFWLLYTAPVSHSCLSPSIQLFCLAPAPTRFLYTTPVSCSCPGVHLHLLSLISRSKVLYWAPSPAPGRLLCKYIQLLSQFLYTALVLTF